MRKICLLAIPVFLLLLCTTGCVVNKAISANAVADNLAVEKAQNEMLLLNVLRGKDHLPMYVTGISKITGSIKAEASLNASVPFGSVQSDRTHSLGTPYFVASPTATYNWNPSFDVNVFDTSDFMGGFMAPVSGDIFAYYWHLGYFKEFLLHLMVLKVEVKVKHGVCEAQKGSKLPVDEYSLRNNHESGTKEPVELEQFADWVSDFLTKGPHFGEGTADPLGPSLSGDEARRALIRGLPDGLTLTKEGERFQFRKDKFPMVLKLDEKPGVLERLYSWMADAYKSQVSKSDPSGGIESRHRDEAYEPETDADVCPGSATADDISSKASDGVFSVSGPIQLTHNSLPDKMTISLHLRSPEAMLYYLGEWARFEETGKTLYVCMHDKLEPLFVVSRSADCPRSIVATTGEGMTYFIPGPKVEHNESCEGAKKSAWRDLPCDPGRSLHALAVVSQLIALQKSAKDLTTTSVVRVVGQ